MATWLVRDGKVGERGQIALQDTIVAIGPKDNRSGSTAQPLSTAGPQGHGQLADFLGKTAVIAQFAAKSLHFADPLLQRIIAAWPDLPAPARVRMLAVLSANGS